METVDAAELVDLCERYGIRLDEAEVETVRELTNEKLGGLDAVTDLTSEGDSELDSVRYVRDPESNPNNALVTSCSVPSRSEGILTGTTVGIKDSIAVGGVPMTCASAVFSDYVPTSDAVVVERLREAGGTITAKTNLDEFGNAGQGTNGARGPITNPVDSERTAGGSSGGSAAAVANDLVAVAIGGDTGGSVRIPAAYCGVVGLKPTYGLVPTTGSVENTNALDHLGPITTSVSQSARVLEAIAGKDRRDPKSMAAAGRDDYRVGGYVRELADPVTPEELSIGVPTQCFEGATEPAVAEQTLETIDRLVAAGASVTPIDVPNFEYAKSIKNTLTYAANAAYWRDYGVSYRRRSPPDTDYQAEFAERSRERSEELNQQLKARLLAGAHIHQSRGGDLVVHALTAARQMRSDVVDVLSRVDVLVTPTMPTVAPILGERLPEFDYAQNVRIANIAHVPAITVPNGRVDGMPVALQVMGPPFGEHLLLRVAELVESNAAD